MTRTLGIIGHPVAHSLSPVFQTAALRHCGLDVTYEAWDTPFSALRSRVHALRGDTMLGANVTIPHKQAVITMLDELGGQSAAVGAVNTIVNRDGRLFGFNTDGPGFVRSLRAEAAFDPAGRSFLLLGAGGAARGIAFALLEAGADRVALSNRTAERAQSLATALRSAGRGSVDVLSFPSSPVGFDCVVNTTSVGMHGTGAEDESPCDLSVAGPGTLAVDIVYVPEETAFLRTARAVGLRTVPGLPMLIYQGALSFELWTGVTAPVDVMFEAARSELARRESVRSAAP
jgi:shikimate dehydrogenase